jgi:hypothetical protein
MKDMRLRTEPREHAPAAIMIQISGDRKVKALPLSPDDGANVSKALCRALDIDHTLVSDTENIKKNIDVVVRVNMLMSYMLFALALYDDNYELETPDYEGETDQDVLAYALSVEKEMKTKFGKCHFSYADVIEVMSESAGLALAGESRKNG